jgi:hypothetical protein
MASPGPSAPAFQPPMPTPAGDSSMMPRQFPQGAIQTAGYYPPYYGYGYAPTVPAGYNYGYGYGYAPPVYQANVPYYWNAGR